MGEKRLSQEGLKLIACLTMLIDHIGAVLIPNIGLRVIGRIAFPIYCFLLCEGVEHTRDVKRYGMRLAAGALLSEIPFDLLFFGKLTWEYQSVMVTLLLGYIALLGIRQWKKTWLLIPAALLAELLCADYGGLGVLLIAVIAMTDNILRTVLMALVFFFMGGYALNLGILEVPIQLFALLALIPMGLYSGKKTTSSRSAQWGFYLFYPVHMVILLLLK